MEMLNRLGMYRFMARTDAAPLARAPALVAVVADNDCAGTLDAGQLLERLWIQLNASGIAVHPYYVLADQLVRLREGRVPPRLVDQVASLAEESRAFFELAEGQIPQILFRVGYPTRKAVRSRRRPLNEVATIRS